MPGRASRGWNEDVGPQPRGPLVTAQVFVTDTGVRVPAVTTTQMREVDRIAIAWDAPSLQQMMENAGRALAETIIEMVGDGWRLQPVVVLAGVGGNGGGGICAARHLANHGGDVTVVAGRHETLGAAAAQQLEVFRHTGGRLASIDAMSPLDAALIADAIIGYSLAGPPRGEALAMIEWANVQHAPVLALDVPSGVDATTGEASGTAISAVATITLALPKTGLDAPAAGRVWLADIGIPGKVYHQVGIDFESPIFDGRFRVALTPV